MKRSDRASGRLLARTSRLWVTAAVAAASACAHAHAAPASTAAAAPGSPSSAPEATAPPAVAKSDGATRTLSNEDLGFTLEVPTGSDLVSNGEPGVLARSPDGTTLRVFHEHLAGTATADGCWERLLSRVGSDIPSHPKTIAELQAEAAKGLERGDRRVYLAPFPRGESCLVFVAEGPRSSQTLADAAPVAIGSFKAGQPSPALAAQLEVDAGLQLIGDKKYGAAVERFERALKHDPNELRALFGAGIAAYFAGPELAGKAVDYLSKVVAAHYDTEEGGAEGLRPDQYRDALMYLGLAYAATHQFPHASSTLAELVDRFPEDAIGRYNFACVLALAGDSDEALEQLGDAIQRDPELATHAKEDDDLRSLRPLPAWKALLGAVDHHPAAAGP